MPSEAPTQERRLRRRRRRWRAALLAEVCENVIAAVGDDGARADHDAVLALRVAPVHRDIIALAVRRQLPVTKTAVVAARPRRAWFPPGVAVHV
jgi:hypothetical protein